MRTGSSNRRRASATANSNTFLSENSGRLPLTEAPASSGTMTPLSHRPINTSCGAPSRNWTSFRVIDSSADIVMYRLLSALGCLRLRAFTNQFPETRGGRHDCCGRGRQMPRDARSMTAGERELLVFRSNLTRASVFPDTPPNPEWTFPIWSCQIRFWRSHPCDLAYSQARCRRP